MRVISIFLIVLMLFTTIATFSGCGSNDDDCFICGGSGYYQKKDCPGC